MYHTAVEISLAGSTSYSDVAARLTGYSNPNLSWRITFLMMKLYSPQVSNDFPVLLATDSASLAMRGKFNTGPYGGAWRALSYQFGDVGVSAPRPIPDISLIVGGLCFRKDLKDYIFPIQADGLEMLPILASGREWLVVNCLNTVREYDREESVIYRGLDGSAFLFNHLLVPCTSIKDFDVFVVEDSNRATLFVLPSFVARIARLGLRGLRFRELGEGI